MYRCIYVCICSVLFLWRLRRAPTSSKNVHVCVRKGMVSVIYIDRVTPPGVHLYLSIDLSISISIHLGLTLTP